MLYPENQTKVANAIKLLQGEINTRMTVIEALQEALDALLIEATGSPAAEMSKSEVLEYLGISDTSLSRYMAGRVPGTKPSFPEPVSSVGRSLRWRRTDINQWKSSFTVNHVQG